MQFPKEHWLWFAMLIPALVLLTWLVKKPIRLIWGVLILVFFLCITSQSEQVFGVNFYSLAIGLLAGLCIGTLAMAMSQSSSSDEIQKKPDEIQKVIESVARRVDKGG